MKTNRQLVDAIRRLASPLRPRPPQPRLPERLPDLSTVKAVLFDVYGTLIQSGCGDIGVRNGNTSDQAQFFEDTLAATGISIQSESAAKTGIKFFTDTIKQTHTKAHRSGVDCPEINIINIWFAVFAKLLEKKLISTSITEIKIRHVAVEFENRINPVWPMPGWDECLTALRRANLRLGIVSNAQFFTPLLFPALTGYQLSELGFNPELCAWSYLQGLAKPASELFKTPLRQLKHKYQIEPESVLMVGNDLLNDIAAAARCGCRTALFAGDTRSLRLRTDNLECARLKPDCVISDLQQLKTVLGLNA